eukprot:gb/GECG01012787.1/.p1 GENE.gb/GECG01012787.1/~~gb/GECG01012787.1/.p1  ORF type:complete len:1691 (+),score=208.38 gb/GECG01012787.1/:1-5073(+)
MSSHAPPPPPPQYRGNQKQTIKKPPPPPAPARRNQQDATPKPPPPNKPPPGRRTSGAGQPQRAKMVSIPADTDTDAFTKEKPQSKRSPPAPPPKRPETSIGQRTEATESMDSKGDAKAVSSSTGRNDASTAKALNATAVSINTSSDADVAHAEATSSSNVSSFPKTGSSPASNAASSPGPAAPDRKSHTDTQAVPAAESHSGSPAASNTASSTRPSAPMRSSQADTQTESQTNPSKAASSTGSSLPDRESQTDTQNAATVVTSSNTSSLSEETQSNAGGPNFTSARSPSSSVAKADQVRTTPSSSLAFHGNKEADLDSSVTPAVVGSSSSLSGLDTQTSSAVVASTSISPTQQTQNGTTVRAPSSSGESQGDHQPASSSSTFASRSDAPATLPTSVAAASLHEEERSDVQSEASFSVHVSEFVDSTKRNSEAQQDETETTHAAVNPVGKTNSAVTTQNARSMSTVPTVSDSSGAPASSTSSSTQIVQAQHYEDDSGDSSSAQADPQDDATGPRKPKLGMLSRKKSTAGSQASPSMQSSGKKESRKRSIKGRSHELPPKPKVPVKNTKVDDPSRASDDLAPLTVDAAPLGRPQSDAQHAQGSEGGTTSSTKEAVSASESMDIDSSARLADSSLPTSKPADESPRQDETQTPEHESGTVRVSTSAESKGPNSEGQRNMEGTTSSTDTFSIPQGKNMLETAPVSPQPPKAKPGQSLLKLSESVSSDRGSNDPIPADAFSREELVVLSKPPLSTRNIQSHANSSSASVHTGSVSGVQRTDVSSQASAIGDSKYVTGYPEDIQHGAATSDARASSSGSSVMQSRQENGLSESLPSISGESSVKARSKATDKSRSSNVDQPTLPTDTADQLSAQSVPADTHSFDHSCTSRSTPISVDSYSSMVNAITSPPTNGRVTGVYSADVASSRDVSESAPVKRATSSHALPSVSQGPLVTDSSMRKTTIDSHRRTATGVNEAIGDPPSQEQTVSQQTWQRRNDDEGWKRENERHSKLPSRSTDNGLTFRDEIEQRISDLQEFARHKNATDGVLNKEEGPETATKAIPAAVTSSLMSTRKRTKPSMNQHVSSQASNKPLHSGYPTTRKGSLEPMSDMIVGRADSSHPIPEWYVECLAMSRILQTILRILRNERVCIPFELSMLTTDDWVQAPANLVSLVSYMNSFNLPKTARACRNLTACNDSSHSEANKLLPLVIFLNTLSRLPNPVQQLQQSSTKSDDRQLQYLSSLRKHKQCLKEKLESLKAEKDLRRRGIDELLQSYLRELGVYTSPATIHTVDTYAADYPKLRRLFDELNYYYRSVHSSHLDKCKVLTVNRAIQAGRPVQAAREYIMGLKNHVRDTRHHYFSKARMERRRKIVERWQTSEEADDLYETTRRKQLEYHIKSLHERNFAAHDALIRLAALKKYPIDSYSLEQLSEMVTDAMSHFPSAARRLKEAGLVKHGRFHVAPSAEAVSSLIQSRNTARLNNIRNEWNQCEYTSPGSDNLSLILRRRGKASRKFYMKTWEWWKRNFHRLRHCVSEQNRQVIQSKMANFDERLLQIISRRPHLFQLKKKREVSVSTAQFWPAINTKSDTPTSVRSIASIETSGKDTVTPKGIQNKHVGDWLAVSQGDIPPHLSPRWATSVNGFPKRNPRPRRHSVASVDFSKLALPQYRRGKRRRNSWSNPMLDTMISWQRSVPNRTR